MKKNKINTWDSIQVIINWKSKNNKFFTSAHITNWIDPNETSALSDQKISIVGTKGRISCDQKNRGVVAVSTGNHGKGVAHAAKTLGIKALIFMSKMVPNYRRQAIEDLGAQVIIQGNNSDEADKIACNYAKENSMEMIHPFDDPLVISGQGTIGLEIQ